MKKSLSWYRWYHGWLLLLPTVLGLVLFRIGPMFWSMALAFSRWDLLAPLEWIGGENFAELLRKSLSIAVLKNTLVFSLIYVLVVVSAGLLLAVLLDRRFTGVYFFRAAFYVPVVTSAVAVGIVWYWILSPDYGVLSAVFKIFRIEMPVWLGDKAWALFSVVGIQAWKMCGYYMVIYLTGLQQIPPSLLEAGRIDGANRWQRFWRITWPLLSATTFFIIFVAIIDSFKNFEMIYTLTRGGPNNASNTLSYDIYVNAFIHYRYGYASAEAVILLLIIGIITAVNFITKKRWVEYF
ncbi:MAG: sugar ABC transporter permease, partial [Spirochaetota bacterium]